MLVSLLNIFYFKDKVNEDNNTKQKSTTTTLTKKKKKEIDLPIIPRVLDANKNELNRLIEQEVKYSDDKTRQKLLSDLPTIQDWLPRCINPITDPTGESFFLS